MWSRFGGNGMCRQADNGAGGSGGTPAAGSAANTDAGNGGTPAGASATPTFETWYAGLDAAQKGLVDGHVTGLKTALSSERTERANLVKQIGELQKGAGKGSDLEKQLSDLQNTLQLTERRATFAEDAIRPEVGCVNVKAAYALAMAEELFDRQGRPDWTRLKPAAPELFRRIGAGSADGGTGTLGAGTLGAGGQGPRVGMNELIRRAAGRG